jgi:hypothetical protein
MLSLSLFFTWKTFGIIACYILRVALEGAILKFRTIPKLALDLYYIAVVFIVFDVAQTNPPSRFYQITTEWSKLCKGMDNTKWLIAFLLAVIIFWVVLICVFRGYLRIESITNLAFLKKALFLGVGATITVIVFLTAVAVQ